MSAMSEQPQEPQGWDEDGMPANMPPMSAQVDCSQFRLRVHEYIDHEMTESDCERLKVHLERCAECVAEYERDLLLKAIVRRSCGAEQAPVALRRQIIASITTVRIEGRGYFTG